MFHAVDERPLVVVGQVLDRIRQVDADGDAVSRSLGVKLGNRQVARFGRVASANANKLADNRQCTP